jgi:glucan 1,6-alpha-isomaltosidase
LAGLAGSSVGAGVLGAASPSGASESSEAALEQAPTAVPGFRPGGPGPLYWSTYDYENVLNTIIPESVWKTNIDWVAETFRDYGYTMVCTDGWIDNTQKVTKHGYIVSQADDWEHDWAWWAKYLESKGMQLGVYYNPLWATKSAVTDPWSVGQTSRSATSSTRTTISMAAGSCSGSTPPATAPRST